MHIFFNDIIRKTFNRGITFIQVIRHKIISLNKICVLSRKISTLYNLQRLAIKDITLSVSLSSDTCNKIFEMSV